MTIRFAKKEDKKQVLQLLDELLTDISCVLGTKPTHQPVVKAGNEIFDDVLKRNDFKIFVAEDNKKILGIATVFLYPVVRRGHYRAQIEELIVNKSSRGKGVGSKLLQAVLLYCKKQGIPTMRLNSGLKLKNAHRFYEKHGGKVTEKMFRFDIK